MLSATFEEADLIPQLVRTVIKLFLSYPPERYQSFRKMVAVTMRVGRRSTIALATVGALASTGTAYLGARNLLVGQATQARTIWSTVSAICCGWASRVNTMSQPAGMS